MRAAASQPAVVIDQLIAQLFINPCCVGKLPRRQQNRVGGYLELTSGDRNGRTAPRRIGLAQFRANELDRLDLLLIADEANRRNQKLHRDRLFVQGGQLARCNEHLFFGTTVPHAHMIIRCTRNGPRVPLLATLIFKHQCGGSYSLGRACAVHRRESATDHHNMTPHLGRSSRIGFKKKVEAMPYPIQLRSRQVEQIGAQCAGRKNDGVTPGAKIANCRRRTDLPIAYDLHTQLAYLVNLLRDDVARKAKLRDSLVHHSARLVVSLIDRDGMAPASQFTRCS